jgi:hypothetical protein
MGEAPAENVIVVDDRSREWAPLIRKLRWIGLEEGSASPGTGCEQFACGGERQGVGWAATND